LASIALMTLDHRQQHLESVRSLLSLAASPLQYAADLPANGVDWFSGALTSRKQLLSENRELHAQNLVLRGRLQQFEALEAENMRLRDLLASSFKIGDRVLIAELLSVDLDPYRQQVVINKGSASGVFVGQPVLDADAVMGQVIRVTPFTSTVLLITDASHALPIQVNRNGLRTIAEGTGLINRLELPHLPNNADIQIGDLLVTSGLGGHFPPGYPVAQVTDVIREPGRPFATVVATPSAHLDRSREVLLVWTIHPITPTHPPSDQSAAAAPQSTSAAADATESVAQPASTSVQPRE
jgi:rod shape-determining protein MreC